MILPAAFEHGTLLPAAWREVRHRLTQIGGFDSSCNLRLHAVVSDYDDRQVLPRSVCIQLETSRVALWRLIHRVRVRANRDFGTGNPVGILVQREATNSRSQPSIEGWEHHRGAERGSYQKVET